ncbi:hypothetical protein AAC387_Pa06g1713 [Persea americana]
MAHHSQLLAILKASAKHETPSKAKQIHAHIIKSGLEQCSILPNNLIHMYGKYGLLQNALSLFDKMPHRDVVSWASILATLTHADQSRHALAIFPNMITLNESNLITADDDIFQARMLSISICSFQIPNCSFSFSYSHSQIRLFFHFLFQSIDRFCIFRAEPRVATVETLLI